MAPAAHFFLIGRRRILAISSGLFLVGSSMGFRGIRGLLEGKNLQTQG